MKLGIVSDIHCQEAALSRAIAALGPVDMLICAGDAIDQARFCNDTVKLLRDFRFETIRGNHEKHFFAGPARHAPHVDPELAEWLASRPYERHLELAGRRLHLVHATTWSADFPYVPPGHREFPRFAESNADIVIYGHTHVPVVRRMGGTLIVNPGSVGEGRPEPHGFVRSCALVDLAAGEARIIDLD